MLIRLATIDDAMQLCRLNVQFNGKGETTLDNIRRSLVNNPQEIIAVAEENSILVGFICVQMKKSFCYDAFMPEITELFVEKEYRRGKVASRLITFIETHCNQNYPFQRIELLTGKRNLVAQAFYKSIGYHDDGELHLSKLHEDMKCQ